MKKVIAIVAIATLAACGGASTEATTNPVAVTTVDSTSVVTDSIATGTATPTTEVEAPRIEKELPEAVN
jgi:ABC-type glycerol-3-phosphate transport system substrate-binding protein